MQDKIEVEKLSETKCKISIQVTAENVDKKFTEFFEEIKKQIEVPGFRKGKAPIARLKQLYSDKVRPSISQMLLSEYYAKALKENEINPIGNPTIENKEQNMKYIGKFGFDNSYSVDVLVEILPTFEPTGYKDLVLENPTYDYEKLFDIKMSEYQKQFAERNQITERGAKPQDSLVLDFYGFIDGEQFDGGTSEGHIIDQLGSGNLIPGFEDQLVGMKVGETKDIIVIFPSEYQAEHLAGKEATFKTTVQSIVEISPAKIDKDLAMMVGHESVDELKQHIHLYVENECKFNTKQILNHQISSKLLEINEFEIPETMLQDEQLRLLGKGKLDDLAPKIKEELKKAAEYNIKRAIIMDSIYEKEDEIEVTPDELNGMLERRAKENNQTKDELVSNLYNSGQMDNFIGVLKNSRVIDFIISNSKQESEESNGNEQ